MSRDNGKQVDGEGLNRRRFVKALGAAGGTAALGSFGVSSVAATSGSQSKREPVHGRKRGQLLREADRSPAVRFAAEKLGKRGGVESVFKYTLQDGTTGYGVTFGTPKSKHGQTINYFQTSSGPTVFGGKPVGNGMMGVIPDGKVVVESKGTPRGKRAVESLHKNTDFQSFKKTLDKKQINEDGILVAHTDNNLSAPTNIIIPVEKNGNPAGKVVLKGTGWPSSSSIQNYSLTSPRSESPVLAQDGSCQAFCYAVTVAGTFGCAAGCTYFLGPELTIECGEFCEELAAENCLPLCREYT